MTAVGPWAPLDNSAASHERVGGVAGVWMCLMDTLDQFVCDGTDRKGLGCVLRATFFGAKSGPSELLRFHRTYFIYEGIPYSK